MRRAPERVEGWRLALRLVRPEDAEFIHGLRTDPDISRHLSPVTGTVEDQRRWIEAYMAREVAGAECYYLITRRDDGRPCGTVRLYGITEQSFTWGSWILSADKPPKAALESAVLVYTIAFDHLGLERAEFDVRIDNERTLAFHRRFGATETHRDGRDVFFRLTREEFDSLGAMPRQAPRRASLVRALAKSMDRQTRRPKNLDGYEPDAQ